MRFDPRGMTQQERDEMIRQYEESIRPVQSNVEVPRPDPAPANVEISRPYPVPAGFGNEGFGNQPQIGDPITQDLRPLTSGIAGPDVTGQAMPRPNPGGNPNFAPNPYAFQRPPMFGGGFGGGFGRPPMGGGKGGYRPPMYGGGFGGPPMFGPPPTQMGPMKGGPRPPMYGGGFGGQPSFGGGFGGQMTGGSLGSAINNMSMPVFPRPQQPMINRQDSANQLLGSGIAGIGLYNQQTGGNPQPTNPYSTGFGMGFQQQPNQQPMGGGKGGGRTEQNINASSGPGIGKGG